MVSALLSRFTSRRGEPWHGIRGPLCDSPSHKRAINPGDKRSVTVTRGHPPWPRQPVSSSSAPTVTNSSTPARALAGIGLNRPNSGALGRALPAVAMAISASPSWVKIIIDWVGARPAWLPDWSGASARLRAAAAAGGGLARVVLAGIAPRSPAVLDARFSHAAPVAPALLLAPCRCDVLERTPRVLLLAGDLAAALTCPDTNAPLVGVGPVTGVPGHPAVCPCQRARFGR